MEETSGEYRSKYETALVEQSQKTDAEKNQLNDEIRELRERLVNNNNNVKIIFLTDLRMFSSLF